jgi:surface polysaccharide O-acyltransferase-like enzyme
MSNIDAVAVKNETGYLNILRVYACITVVIYHAFLYIILFHGSSLTISEEQICTIMINLWLWRLPTFAMISGVLFLNPQKEISLKKLFTKYILRIVLALFLFGVPYAFLEIFFDAHYRFNAGQTGQAIINVLQGKTWDHMWYLYMITGLYLFVPLLKIFVMYTSKRILEYVLIILFIFTSLIPSLQNSLSIYFGIYIPVNSVFVFYFLLGHYIHQYDIRVNNKVLLLMSTLYLLLVVLFIPNSPFTNGDCPFCFYNQISPFIVMITFAVFCLVRQNIKTNKFHDFISKQSFGIYLIHPLFLHIFYKLLKFTPEKYPFITVITTVTIVTVLASLLFTVLCRKIKVIKKYVL